MATPSQFPSLQELFDVRDKRAVVTGGGSGIGRMIAIALASNGAHVYITGRRRERLEQTAREFQGPGKIVPLVGDISSQEGIKDLLDQYKKHEKLVDVIVNNAGVSLKEAKIPSELANKADLIQAEMEKHTFESYQAHFATNATSHYFIAVAFLPLLRKAQALSQERGRIETPVIININSIGQYKTMLAQGLIYTASKAAAKHISDSMSALLEPFKIRSNTVSPGLFPSDGATPEVVEQYAPLTPAGRAGRMEDIGGLILFLASNAGAYMNGADIKIDGGLTMSLGSYL